MKQFKPLILLFLFVTATAMFFVYVKPYLNRKPAINPEDRKSGKDKVLENYGNQIDSAANIFNISPAYLKALCMLECGGRKYFEPRFEAHVFRRLKKVKNGELSNYEHVTREMLADANDEALKNLASSWGPFQLMGYKCLLLGIKVRDIRGENSVYYGAKWIDLTYGKYLKQKRYKDAFHIHNTGKVYPLNGKSLTYDPSYCKDGLKYMDFFSKETENTLKD